MQRAVVVVVVLAVQVSACVPESACDSPDAPDITFDQAIVVTPGSALTLTGTLSAEARIDQLLVGGTSAKGTSANFATWEVTVPSSRFDGTEGMWELETRATYCGTEHVETKSITVSVPSPTISLEGVPPDTCYIGANGIGEARLVVTADATYAGARVTLASPEGTQILPGNSVTLDAQGQAEATLISVGKQDAAVSVTATTGNRSFASKPIIVAGPPVFDAEPKSIKNNLSVPIFVKSMGRFQSCSADLPAGATATLKLNTGDQELALAETTIPAPPECGQTVLVRVAFPAAAPLGSSIVLLCVDTYGQASTRVVSSAGPEVSSE